MFLHFMEQLGKQYNKDENYSMHTNARESRLQQTIQFSSVFYITFKLGFRRLLAEYFCTKWNN